MTIWRMFIACWIPKATNTHTVYITLIAFPLHQWLHERASLLRYTLHCLSCLFLVLLLDIYSKHSQIIYYTWSLFRTLFIYSVLSNYVYFLINLSTHLRLWVG